VKKMFKSKNLVSNFVKEIRCSSMMLFKHLGASLSFIFGFIYEFRFLF